MYVRGGGRLQCCHIMSQYNLGSNFRSLTDQYFEVHYVQILFIDFIHVI